jgi:hypothetical protein
MATFDAGRLTTSPWQGRELRKKIEVSPTYANTFVAPKRSPKPLNTRGQIPSSSNPVSICMSAGNRLPSVVILCPSYVMLNSALISLSNSRQETAPEDATCFPRPASICDVVSGLEDAIEEDRGAAATPSDRKAPQIEQFSQSSRQTCNSSRVLPQVGHLQPVQW